MDKDPGVIRAEIEQTRERVGDEVDAHQLQDRRRSARE